MAVANVKTRWIDGDLYFFDKAGNEIFHVDGTNRKIVAPTGAEFDLSAASVNLPAGLVLEADLAPNSLTGVAVGNVADDNLVGGIPVLHRLSIADGATGDIDYVLTHKERIVDAWLVKTGGAGHASEDTIQLKNGATAITEALAVGAADKARKQFVEFDDAQWEIAAGGTLRVTRTKGAGGGNNVECTVYVLAVRVA